MKTHDTLIPTRFMCSICFLIVNIMVSTFFAQIFLQNFLIFFPPDLFDNARKYYCFSSEKIFRSSLQRKQFVDDFCPYFQFNLFRIEFDRFHRRIQYVPSSYQCSLYNISFSWLHFFLRTDNGSLALHVFLVYYSFFLIASCCPGSLSHRQYLLSGRSKQIVNK
jgi:hypothetical protein